MPNKEALREFQNRLAQRLQSAQQVGATASWLAVEAGVDRYLLPLSHAGEVFACADIQPIPYVHPWFIGVVNLRGNLHGVIDLVGFIRNQSRPPPEEAAQTQSRLVALSPLLGTNCALLIDRLLGLRTVDSFVASDSAPEDQPAYYGHLYTDTSGQQWQELNLQKLSRDPAFLDVGA